MIRTASSTAVAAGCCFRYCLLLLSICRILADATATAAAASGLGCTTCRVCCPRCKESVRDVKMLHLRTPPLQVGDKDFAARLHEAKYKNAPRESASFNQNARTLHAKGDVELKCKDAPHQNKNCNQNARRSTRKRKFKPKCNRNARTLHARTRFSIKMKGHSRRERDFQTECN